MRVSYEQALELDPDKAAQESREAGEDLVVYLKEDQELTGPKAEHWAMMAHRIVVENDKGKVIRVLKDRGGDFSAEPEQPKPMAAELFAQVEERRKAQEAEASEQTPK